MTVVAEGGLWPVCILGSGIEIYLIRIFFFKGVKGAIILLWRTGSSQILGHTRRSRVARHITRKHASWTSGRARDRTSRGTGSRERDDYTLSLPAVGG